MIVRVVVADAAVARFYDMDRHDSPMHETVTMQDPLAHLHDREFTSDRPGRMTAHGSADRSKRGAVAHHGLGSEADSPRVHEMRAFVHRIAQELEKSLQEKKFDRMVLMAGPRVLGMLRDALSPAARLSVAAEINNDLIHLGVEAVRAHLPQEVFWSK
jgi:protein required for attachment to host cells